MKTPKWIVVSALAFLVSAGPALAGIGGTALGTAGPPSSLGGFFVVPFGLDPNPTLLNTSAVAVPSTAAPSGSILFDVALEHFTIGAPPQWGTWSNGYTRDVYWLDTLQFVDLTDPNAPLDVTATLKITLPANTKAFYLYVEPGNDPLAGGNYLFDVKGFTTVPGEQFDFLAQPISGIGGASGFGFYVDNPASSLGAVEVTGKDIWAFDGFAVGEFGIDAALTPVPDSGSTVLLLGASVLLLAALRRRFSS
jgi:hypothetical protein